MTVSFFKIVWYVFPPELFVTLHDHIIVRDMNILLHMQLNVNKLDHLYYTTCI